MTDKAGLLSDGASGVQDDKVRNTAHVEFRGQLGIALRVDLDYDSVASHIRSRLGIFQAAGMVSFDGKGNVTGALTSNSNTGAGQPLVSSGTVSISSNCSGSTSKGSSTGGKGVLHIPQRPVSVRCFAGTRFFCPQILHVRMIAI